VNNNFYQVQANYTNGCSRKTVSTSSTYHKAVINAGCRLANPEGEEELAPEAKAYPNPFGNQLTLEYHLSADASPLITLYDIQGKVVAEKSVENQVAGDYETQMDTEGLPKGMYLLTLKAGEEIHTLKLVKE
jgi:hypothetical protein